MSYLKSESSTSTPPFSPLMLFHLLCGRLFSMPNPLRVGVVSWGGGSVRSDSLARYSDTVHDHRSQARPLKTQHNSGTDKRLQPQLHVCLPTSGVAGCRTLKCASRRRSLKPHRVWRRMAYPPESPYLSFLSSIGVKFAKFSLPQANTIV